MNLGSNDPWINNNQRLMTLPILSRLDSGLGRYLNGFKMLLQSMKTCGNNLNIKPI